MSDIFISYASEDRAKTVILAQVLETQGWSVWWDRSIPIGKSYEHVIEEALDEAKCVIVLWSKVSITSEWVRAEVAEAQRQEKLFPLNIDNCNPPLVYRALQTADFSSWSGETTEAVFLRLTAAIQEHIGTYVSKAETDSEIKEEPTKSRNNHSQPAPTKAPEISNVQQSQDSGKVKIKSETTPSWDQSTSGQDENKKPKWIAPFSAILLLSLLIAAFLIYEKKSPKTDSRNDISTSPEKVITTNIPEKATTANIIEPEMVAIPKGCFQIGSPETEQGRFDNERQHQVCVAAFKLGKYEVSYDEYEKYCDMTGCLYPDDNGWARENRPVVNVSWNGATAYAEWLSKQTRKRFRLPTEAEWEYATRGNKKPATRFPWGNEIGSNKANCNNCGSQWDSNKTAPVGSFAEYGFGLYDMVGNVFEWTCSRYDKNYNGFENKCAEKGDSSPRVIRSGSWSNLPRYARSAHRFGSHLDARDNSLGFRLAQD